MLRFIVRRATLAVVTASAFACASSGTTPNGATSTSGTSGTSGASGVGVAGSPSPTTASRHDRTLIMADEMTNTAASNLFEVVQRLHPEWLVLRNQASASASSRASAGGAGVQVYLD